MNLKKSEPSEWECELFGTRSPGGMIFRPAKGNEPNWFWRWMQLLILGNKWVHRPSLEGK